MCPTAKGTKSLKCFNFLIDSGPFLYVFDLMHPSHHVTIIMPGFKTKYKNIYIFIIVLFFVLYLHMLCF